MDQQELQHLSERLRVAERDRTPIPQPSAGSALDIESAYAVQQLALDRRLGEGELLVGHKVGLTSRAMQAQLGVDSPDFGFVTDAMVVPADGHLAVGELISPRLEPEFAFRMSADLPSGASLTQVRDAIGAVAVSIEIIDSRVADWQITLADTVADNASSARVAVGEWVPASPDLLDSLPATTITLTRDGDEVAAGPGEAVLGDPIVAVHWLHTTLAELGGGLTAGSLVLAGAVTGALPLDPGSYWQVTAPGFPAVGFTSTATSKE